MSYTVLVTCLKCRFWPLDSTYALAFAGFYLTTQPVLKLMFRVKADSKYSARRLHFLVVTIYLSFIGHMHMLKLCDM